jgi:hypothetical protein
VALDLTYPNIIKNFGAHNVAGRLESRAFLGWFLESYFRLEEIEAQESICDGPDDKGVDGVYVDLNLERVVVFQAKLFQNEKKTLGDSSLREFVGSIEQFKTKEKVEHVTATTGNLELRELLKDRGVSDLVEKGFEVVGVFVTNVKRDANAENFLAQRPDINLYDRDALQMKWVSPGDNAPMKGEVSFSLDGHTPIEYKTTEATVYIAPLLASELVRLDGIQSTELFDWNVRKSLGKTKVNKAIADSVSDQAEHKNFVLYHNGLTVLAEAAEQTTDDKLKIKGYTVVNGCQSLTTLFQQRAKLSNELKVITRIVKLSPQSELAAKITRHSNNQNSISARDLQSNSNIQRRLQKEFEDQFYGQVYYEIKRGEVSSAPHLITNEEAARLLLAFDLQEPWACHQSYRLFDDLHSEIFGRPEVNADRIAALDALKAAILLSILRLKDELFASYRLTQYFLMFLLRKAFEIDTEGRRFIENPSTYVKRVGVTGVHTIALSILEDLVIDLNAELQERVEAQKPFDHKRELKSPVAVRKLASDVTTMYQKGVNRGKSAAFSDQLNEVIKEKESSGRKKR